MMFKETYTAIKTFTVIVIAIVSSPSLISTCLASPVDSLQEMNAIKDDGCNDEVTSEQRSCPEVYRRYRAMEQEYHRPQLWRGCNGSYVVDKNIKMAPKDECPDTYQQFIESGEQEWKGCNELYLSNDVKQSDPQSECPDVYLRFEELRLQTGRDQLWQGCNGAYYLDEPTNSNKNECDSCFLALNFFRENNDRGTRISGLGLVFGGDIFMLGLNAEAISSQTLAVNGDDDTLYSLYGFMGLSMNEPISPYVEAGIDLGDLIVGVTDDELRDALDTDECVLTVQMGVCDDLDTYVAVGIQNRPHSHTPFIRAYAKWYSLSENGQDLYIPIYGLSLGMSF